MATLAAQNFLNRLIGSRLINLYLKGSGISSVDSMTMVPLAILLGREAFKAFLMGNQVGGGMLENLEIPLLDDPYIGSYLTLLGVSQLTPETLLPVGLVAAIYELYLRGNNEEKAPQSGGTTSAAARRKAYDPKASLAKQRKERSRTRVRTPPRDRRSPSSSSYYPTPGSIRRGSRGQEIQSF